jgi:hypothetical protein
MKLNSLGNNVGQTVIFRGEIIATVKGLKKESATFCVQKVAKKL